MSIKDNSDDYLKRFDKAMEQWLTAGALTIERDMQLLAPVDTGNLRDSIDSDVDFDNLSATIGTNEEYAIFVEKGTGEFASNGAGRKGGWVYPVEGEKDIDGKQAFVMTYGQKPQPFIKPAMEQNKGNIRTLGNKYFGELSDK